MNKNGWLNLAVFSLVGILISVIVLGFITTGNAQTIHQQHQGMPTNVNMSAQMPMGNMQMQGNMNGTMMPEYSQQQLYQMQQQLNMMQQQINNMNNMNNMQMPQGGMSSGMQMPQSGMSSGMQMPQSSMGGMGMMNGMMGMMGGMNNMSNMQQSGSMSGGGMSGGGMSGGGMSMPMM